MNSYRNHLPQLDANWFLTDGGLETTLIFDDGFELPDFAAFALLDTTAGQAALNRYFDSYVAIAKRDQVGIVLETPTWRASADWGARQGYSVEQLKQLNRHAVEFLREVRRRHQTDSTPVVISGCIGPRGDGYSAQERMTAEEARQYHALQASAFAEAGADLVTAITITYAAEAVGVANAAKDAGVPAVISFTVETDGTLPSGETLREAIEAVDSATGAYPAYFMINCAHPTHFASVLDAGTDWTKRIRGLRANASSLSHAELDESETLDTGHPAELAEQYRELRAAHPHLTVVGGCCGTNHQHVDAISRACLGSAT